VSRAQIQRTPSSQWYWAEYSTFSITDEADEHRLTVDGYSGDAGNALRHPSWDANGMQFSTSDNDNDGCGGSNCPMSHGAGWWYACCSYSNINNNGVTRWQGAGTGNPDVPVSRMLIKIV